jgi:hypothetical protein
MPILLVVVRRAWCVTCNGTFDLEPLEIPPARCPLCNSQEWEWGPESSDSRLIRQGIKRLRKRLNPGATSKKRQDRGKKQWRRFKPKPEE